MEFWIILNSPELAIYCLENGVNRIFLDLEKIGKIERQGHLNTWITDHQETDIIRLRNCLPKGKLIVRLNPWNSKSISEIEFAINNGADFLMLPMIKSYDEISSFSSAVSNQIPIIPLIETAESLDLIPKIIKLQGVKELYIGLNDLRLSLGYKFIFEPLVYNLLENPSKILNYENIPWGFGGIARIGQGLIPAELIIGEHVRLGSNRLILSRTFYGNKKYLNSFLKNINLRNEIKKLKEVEEMWKNSNLKDLEKNHNNIIKAVSKLIN